MGGGRDSIKDGIKRPDIHDSEKFIGSIIS